MKRWRSHVESAERLLGLAVARGDVPVKTLDCLYEAVVEITRAINELETSHDDD